MQNTNCYSTPTKRFTRFEPSVRFSERKRALFPSQDSDSDDLGHMSPLELSSSPDRFQSITLQKSCDIEDKYFTLNNSDDENSAPRVGKTSAAGEDKENEKTTENDINILAPNTPSVTESPERDLDSTYVPETPVKDSPTKSLKTPHDTSITNMELPRLARKSLGDISNIDKSNLKRKSDSFGEPTEPKTSKFEQSANKVSKVRTALFTENILPPKSFYPKTEVSKQEFSVRCEAPAKKASSFRKSDKVYLCNRRNGRGRKYCGQINAGVRHGIKKPKHKIKLTKTQLLKAALNIVRNSPLNSYLNNIKKEEFKQENECGVSVEQLQKMDSILKTIHSSAITAKPLSVLSVEEKVVDTRDRSAPVKRPLSPEADVKRKFFKTGPSVATITISSKIKLKVDHGEISLMEKQRRVRKPKLEDIEFDATDLSIPEDKIINDSFTDILKTLEDDSICENIVPNPAAFAMKTESNPNNLTLTAHTSVSASENSILLHSQPTEPVRTTNENPTTNTLQMKKILTQGDDMLLSPTSLVCDLTSGLALDSPKSQAAQNIDLEKLNASKKRICFTENMSDEKKLFPIFYGKQNTQIPAKNPPKENRHVKNIKRIWKPLSDDQTILDAGQKKFGATQCPDCKLLYSVGEPEDEIMHYNYHNAVGVLRYNGWKHERVVNQTHKGRVLQINPNDPKSWWRKVKELLAIINEDLGFVDVPLDTSNKKVFLYVANKQIIGCVLAESKLHAHKMLPRTEEGVDQCSEESYPVKCGISRLWVAASHRKQGIATCLLNVLRAHFIYGHILSTAEIAFSAPTEAGKLFARKYTKTDTYLIYTS